MQVKLKKDTSKLIPIRDYQNYVQERTRKQEQVIQYENDFFRVLKQLVWTRTGPQMRVIILDKQGNFLWEKTAHATSKELVQQWIQEMEATLYA